MRIVFGSGFDGGVWPTLGAHTASFDEAWVGRRGLLRILETVLGLGSAAADITNAERSASLLPALRDRRGAWSSSLETDPLAVARSLLRVRDALVEGGLDPRVEHGALPARVREIVEVTAAAPPGVPDRLRAVAHALASGPRTDIARVEMFDDVHTPVWRRVIAGLRAARVDVVPRAITDAPPTESDLGGARRAPFAPRGDGTLALLRSDCPEEAAYEVAAHLAAVAEPQGALPLVIGGDAVLDAGLSRMGMPTLGARGGRGDDGLLQVAPLVIALAWPERDPERAFELLTLSSSPVRRVVARRLAWALTKEPAVESEAWARALEEALALVPEEERARMADRVAKVFTTSSSRAGHEAMSLGVLDERLQLVRAWLFGRLQREEDPTRLRGAVAQVAAIGRVARAFGAPALGRVELMRIVEQATASVRPLQPRPALAGLARIGDAASITAPADHVVWWGFTSSSEHLPYATAFTAEERAALAAADVELPDAGALAERRAAAFARPLACAAASLVLVCPRRDEHGDDAHPHPLWDEIVARAGGDGAVRVLEVRELSTTRALAKKHFRGRDTAPPVRAWRFPAGSVPRPERESPTSRETLVGCTARAVFERSGLRSIERRLPEGSQLFGDLAHDVIGAVLEELRVRDAHLARDPRGSGASAMTPSEAAARARVVFDQRLPRRAAVLARPDEATQRVRARELCARAAERIVELLREQGFGVVAVEQKLERAGGGRVLEGTPDVVIGDAAALAAGAHKDLVVLDLKSGGDRWRRRSLEGGLALQLVAYAGMLAANGGSEGAAATTGATGTTGTTDVPAAGASAWPGIGYFQIRSRRLLTTDLRLGGLLALEPALLPEQTAARVKKLAAQAEADIAAGRAEAPGVGARIDELQSRLQDGELVIAPPCRFCRFGVLCGRALPGGTSPAAAHSHASATVEPTLPPATPATPATPGAAPARPAGAGGGDGQGRA